jgi:hypothetical protein
MQGVMKFEFWICSYNASVVCMYIVDLRVFTSEENNFILKTRYAISCVANFYNAGIVTDDRRIGSRNDRYFNWRFVTVNKNGHQSSVLSLPR